VILAAVEALTGGPGIDQQILVTTPVVLRQQGDVMM
jgi:hypothetical protein